MVTDRQRVLPGGTTIEGVVSLQSDGFEKAVFNAVDKSLDKDKKL